MRTQHWIWAACLAGTALLGCGGGSDPVDPTPNANVCGDGVVSDQEACDDGNLNNGDGCSSECTVETGFSCTESGCQMLEPPTTCGNGTVDDGEVCDDGNLSSGDGCLGNCLAIEEGYDCPASGGPCVKKGEKPVEPKNVCGDGKVADDEKCDDGNTEDNDGCSKDCKIEPGYECLKPGQKCTLKPISGGCGDGTLNDGEECDDGNRDDYDGCSRFCEVEPGWSCDEDGKNCHTTCGDYYLVGDEVCDDGNTEDGDGCKGDCSAFEDGFVCENLDGMTFCAPPTCGDGVIQVGEECDTGYSATNPDTPSYSWDIKTGKPYCHSCKLTAYCGDGILNGPEECDDGVLDENGNPTLKDGIPVGGDGSYGGCTIDCKKAARCGDGIVQDIEQCDNGQENDGRYNGCKANCEYAPRCGDGIVDDEFEVCDEAFVDALGNVSGGSGLYGHCKPDCSGYSDDGFCGDGKVNATNEECDLGMTDENGKPIGGDGSYGGCNPDCTFAAYCGDGKVDETAGEVCDEGLGYGIGGTGVYGNNCKPDCSGRTGWCGDGYINEGYETCDLGMTDENGNPVGGDGSYDGCNADCTRASYCGDGVQDPGEQCDNGVYGNNGIYGGCKKDCTLASYCGDHTPDPLEDCDLGTAANVGGYGELGATCTAQCKYGSYCGDGIVDTAHGELCDDGYGNSDDTYDGCTKGCVFSARCGDGKVDTKFGEECDNGNQNTPSTYGTCNSVTCTWNAICGDGKVDTANGEECDDGLIVGGKPTGGDGSYDGCTTNCKKAAHCGDGKFDSKYEDCDLGAQNGVSGSGCTSSCTVAKDYECSGNVCTRIPCGNGKLDSDEECDDTLHSAYCKSCMPITGYVCKKSDPPCPTSITGKYCAVSGVECIKITDLYGDGIISKDFEECDDGNNVANDGCTNGTIDPGYICPKAGARCVAAACGDGIRAYGEECDDGNDVANDGCSPRCKREEGFACKVEMNKLTTCSTTQGKCGDGVVQYGEQCDDGNTNSGDGCSSTCQVEPNFKCAFNSSTFAGGACSATSACGNGKLDVESGYVYAEQCDLGTARNGEAGSGCTNDCQIVTGYHCSADGKTCNAGKCRDGNLDAGEECDDGNHYPNDGCSPSCKREFMFDEYIDDDTGKAIYSPKCGDGITLWMIPERDSEGRIKCKNGEVLAAGAKKEGCDGKGGFVPAEECDDGNMISGDGCSSQCKIETGYTCTDFAKEATAKTIDLDITYYDFKAPTGSGTGNGYMTKDFMTEMVSIDSSCKGKGTKCTIGPTGSCVGRGYPDFECAYAGGSCTGMVEKYLDSEGKPVLAKSPSNCTLNNVACSGSHHFWYRSVPGINLTIPSKLTFNQDASDLDKYSFINTAWYPLKDQGFYSSETVGHNRAGNFTSELHTFFQYKGGEKLDFKGDDDVWAFINRTLFVDLGGMQSGVSKSGQLSNAKCVFDNVTSDIVCDPKYDIYEDGIYELHFFQAERCSSGSQYQLTLDGFLKTGKSTCECTGTNCSKTCGNGVVDAGEECDCDSNGMNCKNGAGIAVACLPKSCKLSTCGDGILDTAYGEECDLGAKNGTKSSYCNSRCQLQTCGDGEVGPGEECDLGSANSSTAYGKGKCTNECKNAPFCGDGIKNGTEKCDNGNANRENAYGEGSCTTSCTPGGYCGDGITNGREKCDNGSKNSDTAYGNDSCTTTCQLGHRCGDRVVDPGEDCDNGTGNSNTAYGPTACDATCHKAPFCGDGKVQPGRETCDNGAANSATAYGDGACNEKCQPAPRCGDGVLNNGEECDYGPNNNDTLYGGCSTKCTLNAHCGDGKTNEPYEMCDDGVNDGSYGGCRSNCTRAPFCGDGIKDSNEECDFATSNKDGQYGGCSTECKLNAHCGDGIQNGNEACDEGDEGNKGEYNGCNANCTLAPYCGDGIVNGNEDNPEVCDLGTDRNKGTYGGCNADCTRAPFCGDGEITDDEVCDDGVNDGSYNGCSKNCKTLGPHCGDGIINGEEICDNGAENNNGVYGGCNADCTRAPFCGDGIKNGDEACDYADPSAENCTKTCTTRIN